MGDAIPYGGVLAIAAMAVATYLCRIAGFLLMSRVRLNPPIERALAALPGCIIVSTVLPLAIRSGPDAIAGIVAGIAVMIASRNELVALLCGLATATTIRLLLPGA